MFRSREPEESVEEDHANVPTRVLCPVIPRTFLHFVASHICTSPLFVPTARYVPRCVHPTLHTESPGPKSHSFVTRDVHALHRYTHVPSPTARTLCELQSTRLR
jgi:hypothetical protein